MNHWLVVASGAWKSPTWLGRFVPVALLVCVPVWVTWNGSPVCATPKAFNRQFLNTSETALLDILLNGRSYTQVMATRCRISLFALPLIVTGRLYPRYRSSVLSRLCAQVWLTFKVIPRHSRTSSVV